MRIFGLIGRNIQYSFSKKYFAEKFKREKITNASYEVFDLQSISEVEKLFQNKKIIGLNVTIPYKREIISFLDELSSEAKEIGAVNTIFIKNGKKKGYNTDVIGFEKSFKPLVESQHKKALILGTGGASVAVAYVLSKLKIPYKFVSRSAKENILSYEMLDESIMKNHQIIINCTPLGTFPKIEESPDLPYQFITKEHLVYDLIYNPEKTKLLEKSEKRGAKIKNGYEMLLLQAEASWKIWNQE